MYTGLIIDGNMGVTYGMGENTIVPTNAKAVALVSPLIELVH